MIRIRERSPLVILLAGVVLAYIAGTSLYAIGSAHGDTGSAAPTVEHVLVSAGPVMQATAPSDALAIIGAVLGAVALIITGLHAVLAVIAPRTKTTIDDTLRDDLAALLAMMRGLPGVPAPPADASMAERIAASMRDGTARFVSPPPPRDPQAGRASLLVMVLLVLGAGVLAACSWQQVKSDAKVGEAAAITCAKADALPILALLAEFAVDAIGSVTDTGAIAWGPLESGAEAQGVTTGGCAFKRFVAAIEAAPSPPSSARSLLAPPDNAAGGRAALARVSAHFGGVTWTVQ